MRVEIFNPENPATAPAADREPRHQCGKYIAKVHATCRRRSKPTYNSTHLRRFLHVSSSGHPLQPLSFFRVAKYTIAPPTIMPTIIHCITEPISMLFRLFLYSFVYLPRSCVGRAVVEWNTKCATVCEVTASIGCTPFHNVALAANRTYNLCNTLYPRSTRLLGFSSAVALVLVACDCASILMLLLSLRTLITICRIMSLISRTKLAGE